MNLQLNLSDSKTYKNSSQKARIITENWAYNNLYCPVCGNEKLNKFPNNRPVADFYCHECKAQFELKGSGEKLKDKIVNGAYSAMIARILSDNNPHLFYMNYSVLPNSNCGFVHNLIFVPKYFFTPKIIEKRKPLSPNAKRAGWVGCNILYTDIPEQGKISIIKKDREMDKNNVLLQSKYSEKLNFAAVDKRTWVFEILNIISSLNDEFELRDVYAYKEELSRVYPQNHHIEDKIRQTLQILRDKGIITFEGRGKYKRVNY